MLPATTHFNFSSFFLTHSTVILIPRFDLNASLLKILNGLDCLQGAKPLNSAHWALNNPTPTSLFILITCQPEKYISATIHSILPKDYLPIFVSLPVFSALLTLFKSFTSLS
jgi:hypothetical protein